MTCVDAAARALVPARRRGRTALAAAVPLAEAGEWVCAGFEGVGTVSVPL
jgi:hypothetical protein